MRKVMSLSIRFGENLYGDVANFAEANEMSFSEAVRFIVLFFFELGRQQALDNERLEENLSDWDDQSAA